MSAWVHAAPRPSGAPQRAERAGRRPRRGWMVLVPLWSVLGAVFVPVGVAGLVVFVFQSDYSGDPSPQAWVIWNVVRVVWGVVGFSMFPLFATDLARGQRARADARNAVDPLDMRAARADARRSAFAALLTAAAGVLFLVIVIGVPWILE